MSDRLKEFRERSQKRKQLLAQALGVESPDALKTVLKTEGKDAATKDAGAKGSSEGEPTPAKKAADASSIDEGQHAAIDSTPDMQTAEVDKEDEEVDEIYRDSSTFLKGTQSANPHNDYCQNFVDTGERPQNFIRDVGLANRFEEYPKLRELIRLKDDLIAQTNTPPMYLKCDLETYDLRDLGNKFDVILVEPPLIEYQRSKGIIFDKYWDWDEIERLDIQSVAAQRSFLWIWCGNAEGLERGRNCLKSWGYRRCEDICWIKTNINDPSHNKNLEPNALFQRTKEHCLMGIKGTVKRSTDGDFIHANVDIDLIIEDEPPYGSKDKPVEIFHIIEHFCLGRRRLHIFGRDSTTRPGWLSIGPELTSSNFDPEVYAKFFKDEYLMVCPDEIERLRPKSPNPRNKQGQGDRDKGGRGRGDRGRGRGRGNRNMGEGRGGVGIGRGNPGGRGRGGPMRSMLRGGNFKRGMHHRNEPMMR